MLDRVHAGEGLATDDEQAEFTTALLDVEETFTYLTYRLYALIEDASSESPASVSWEDIGKQLIFARWVKDMGGQIALKASRMEKAIHRNLNEVRENGCAVSMPLFSRHGSPQFEEDNLPPVLAHLKTMLEG
jgi:hypothetical protein